MRVLFICPRFPYPPLKGDQVIVYNRLKTLCKYHKIILLTFYTSENELENIKEVKDFCENIISVKISKNKSIYGIIKGVLCNLKPMQVNYYDSECFKIALNRIIREYKIDIAHVFLLRLVEYIKSFKDIPVVLEAIDSMQLNMERRIRFESGFKKIVFKEELRRLEKFERYIGNIVDHIIVVAKEDRKYFSCQNISIIPNGVDCNEFYPQWDIIKNENSIAFTGNMGYAPNIHAVTWFVQNCFPLLIDKKPDIVFYIVGGNVPAKIKSMDYNKNIIVTGYVKSMGDFLRSCHVSIAPMQSGSGMQNKILEAMASGLPVVTTSLGLGDIKAINGKEIIVQDGIRGFVNAILNCLDSKDYARKIGNAAVEYTKRNHSWDLAAMKINNLYKACIRSNNGHGR